ncbi:MAG TPA: response regulator [Candidatus Competibacter sp.]|nr:response regulator [Candidatus Competibacter sp.]
MEKKTYIVSMIGITDAERNVLRNIFKLSQYRASSYVAAVPGEATDILIVDADDPQAMAEWRQNKESATSAGSSNRSYRPNIPTILVTKESPPDSILHYVRRPFVATRVINALDQVVQKDLRSAKERIIGEDTSKKIIAEPAKTEPDAVKGSSTLTALVVDDSSPVRKQIELELKLFGIEVDAAATGEQAIDFINKNEYNLIFLDVVLPGIDGYQLCKVLKKGKNKKKTPVIMLTSKSSPFDRVKGALAGCDAYLTKPVKQETFQKVVKKYLR